MSKRTYTEIKEQPVFDWSTFLSKTYDQVSPEQTIEAGLKASSWVTCACGAQCAALGRYADGEPKDEFLSQLGLEFMGLIERMHVCRTSLHRTGYEIVRQTAISVLQLIEQRSMNLLAEMGALNEPAGGAYAE